MEIREFKKEDYSEIKNWWIAHKWQPIPVEFLPKTGYIIPNYCAGFLYKTDSKIAIMEFIISNPLTDKDKRSVALDLLINSLCNKAKEDGFKSVFSSLVHPKLIDKYKKNQFFVTDENVTNLMRLI